MTPVSVPPFAIGNANANARHMCHHVKKGHKNRYSHSLSDVTALSIEMRLCVGPISKLKGRECLHLFSFSVRVAVCECVIVFICVVITAGWHDVNPPAVYSRMGEY